MHESKLKNRYVWGWTPVYMNASGSSRTIAWSRLLGKAISCSVPTNKKGMYVHASLHLVSLIWLG